MGRDIYQTSTGDSWIVSINSIYDSCIGTPLIRWLAPWGIWPCRFDGGSMMQCPMISVAFDKYDKVDD